MDQPKRTLSDIKPARRPQPTTKPAMPLPPAPAVPRPEPVAVDAPVSQPEPMPVPAPAEPPKSRGRWLKVFFFVLILSTIIGALAYYALYAHTS